MFCRGWACPAQGHPEGFPYKGHKMSAKNPRNYQPRITDSGWPNAQEKKILKSTEQTEGCIANKGLNLKYTHKTNSFLCKKSGKRTQKEGVFSAFVEQSGASQQVLRAAPKIRTPEANRAKLAGIVEISSRPPKGALHSPSKSNRPLCSFTGELQLQADDLGARSRLLNLIAS